MMRKDGEEIVVPAVVIKRIPKYYRHLERLMEKGVERISSSQLGEIVGVSAPQLRQDLNHFGNFGQQGYGYNVEKLYNALAKVMGIEKKSKMVLVGVGNLGQALVNSNDFEKRGFYLSAIFDVNPKLIGLKIKGIEVRDIAHLEEYIKENNIDIGIITVPAKVAQEIADKMIEAGIKGIWNFAPVDIEGDGEVAIEEMHFTEGLLRLSYRINEK